MQPTVPHRRHDDAPAVFGVLLILVGAAALVLGRTGLNVLDRLGDQGWPLFVILPGLVLIALTATVAPPRGLGFAIAGAIVTTVGGILLYQAATDNWASWAYAWLLIPTAAGAAMVVYGLLTGAQPLVGAGLRVGGIAGIVFLVAAWYFEGLFSGGDTIDLATWGPVLVIALGVIVMLRAFAGPDRDREPAPRVEDVGQPS